MRLGLSTLALFCTLLSGAEKPVFLLNANGDRQTLALEGRPTVVVFISSVCPISNEYIDRMKALYGEFSGRGVGFVFVNSNVNETAREVGEHASAAGFPFPVYRDISNALADRLGASLTPEAFLLDARSKVRYQGPIDDARNPARVKADYLREGIEALLGGKPLPRSSAKATGCTIKRERKAS